MEPSDSTNAEPSVERVRWGLGDFAIAWVGSQAAAVVLLPVVLAITGQGGVYDTARWTISTQALSQVPLYGTMIAFAVFVTRTKGRGPVIDLGLAARSSDLPRGLLIGVAVQLSLFVLYAPLFWLTDLDQHDLDKPARELSDKAHGAGVLLLILVVVIAAPIVEEIFFRGFLLTALERRFGTPIAVAGSAAIFAASHFQALQFPALFVFGSIAGTLFARTRRLGPSIAAHLAFNATAVAFLLA